MEWIDANSNWPDDDNSYYWCAIDGEPVNIFRLVRYPLCSYWQDSVGDEYGIDDTKYIKILKPAKPQQ